MATNNPYETLYNNMRTKFTVVNDNSEYTLGEYMSMKANPVAEASNLPATRSSSPNHSITSIFSYVNEKLTVKKPPARDKVIRRFPFRTSAAAFMTAIVACALMFSYGLFALKAGNIVPTADTEPTVTEEIEEVTEAPKA